jgi:hypothetical protein
VFYRFQYASEVLVVTVLIDTREFKVQPSELTTCRLPWGHLLTLGRPPVLPSLGKWILGSHHLNSLPVR